MRYSIRVELQLRAFGLTSKFRGRNLCLPPMFSRKTSKSLRAFTFIELLVVIAIIVVLAALIVPAARKALESGQRATCLGNMRGLAAGLLSYTADNNNRFPVWGWAYNEPSSYAKPADRVTPPPPYKPRESGRGDVRCGLLMRGGYVTSETAFCCPARRADKDFYGLTKQHTGCTYAVNGTPGLRFKKSESDGLDFPLSALRTPSRTVMLIEEADSNGWSLDNGVVLFDFADPDGYTDKVGTTFHANAGNVVFYDGSARSMTSKEWRVNAFARGKAKAREFFGALYSEP